MQLRFVFPAVFTLMQLAFLSTPAECYGDTKPPSSQQEKTTSKDDIRTPSDHIDLLCKIYKSADDGDSVRKDIDPQLVEDSLGFLHEILLHNNTKMQKLVLQQFQEAVWEEKGNMKWSCLDVYIYVSAAVIPDRRKISEDLIDFWVSGNEKIRIEILDYLPWGYVDLVSSFDIAFDGILSESPGISKKSAQEFCNLCMQWFIRNNGPGYISTGDPWLTPDRCQFYRELFDVMPRNKKFSHCESRDVQLEKIGSTLMVRNEEFNCCWFLFTAAHSMKHKINEDLMKVYLTSPEKHLSVWPALVYWMLHTDYTPSRNVLGSLKQNMSSPDKIVVYISSCAWLGASIKQKEDFQNTLSQVMKGIHHDPILGWLSISKLPVPYRRKAFRFILNRLSRESESSRNAFALSAMPVFSYDTLKLTKEGRELLKFSQTKAQSIEEAFILPHISREEKIEIAHDTLNNEKEDEWLICLAHLLLMDDSLASRRKSREYFRKDNTIPGRGYYLLQLSFFHLEKQSSIRWMISLVKSHDDQSPFFLNSLYVTLFEKKMSENKTHP